MPLSQSKWNTRYFTGACYPYFYFNASKLPERKSGIGFTRCFSMQLTKSDTAGLWMIIVIMISGKFSAESAGLKLFHWLADTVESSDLRLLLLHTCFLGLCRGCSRGRLRMWKLNAASFWWYRALLYLTMGRS